jgi:hypothetical protein
MHLAESAFKRGLDQKPNHSFLCHHFSSNLSAPSASVLIPSSHSAQSSSLAMAALHQYLFQPSIIDENEICMLVVSHILPNREVLQWRPATGEDIPTPNTNEIVVFASFQHGVGLPVCDFLHSHMVQYQIELVHLNPNSIIQIVIFVHLCEAYLGIPPNFPLFKNYFFLTYQSSAANQKVICSVGLQTHPHAAFLDLPLKNSLQGCQGKWFYCENHEPSLPSFIGHFPEFHGAWSEVRIPLKAPQVAALIDMVNLFKEKGLIGVCVAAHWLAHQV